MHIKVIKTFNYQQKSTPRHRWRYLRPAPINFSLLFYSVNSKEYKMAIDTNTSGYKMNVAESVAVGVSSAHVRYIPVLLLISVALTVHKADVPDWSLYSMPLIRYSRFQLSSTC